jgi:hypothetical protein
VFPSGTFDGRGPRFLVCHVPAREHAGATLLLRVLGSCAHRSWFSAARRADADAQGGGALHECSAYAVFDCLSVVTGWGPGNGSHPRRAGMGESTPPGAPATRVAQPAPLAVESDPRHAIERVPAWAGRPEAGWGTALSAAPTSLPQPLEAAAGDARIMDRMPRVAVAEIVLHRAQIGAPVGEVVATGVTQRVWMDVA